MSARLLWTVCLSFLFPSSLLNFDTDNLCASLSEEEISDAISQLRSGRASGVDGITAEAIKLGGAVSVAWFKSLFDDIWKKEVLPDDWKNQLLIPLHKKGSRSICDMPYLASPARSSPRPF